MSKQQISTDNKKTISSSVYWAFADMNVIARRELKRISRSPDEMLASTLVPIVFFLMFRYVFGGAITVPGNDYTEYLVPGILVLACFLGSASTGLGLCTDLERGMIDRFVSLPMARSSVLLGRILASLIRSIFFTVIILVFSLLIGYRFKGTTINNLTAIGLLMLGVLVFSWLFALLALYIKKLESFSAIAPLFAMIIVYFSSAFAPTNTMPLILRGYAENQPVSLIINSIRELFNNQFNSITISKTLIWLVALLFILIPLTIRAYKRVSFR